MARQSSESIIPSVWGIGCQAGENAQETDYAYRIHRRGRGCSAHLRQCGHDLSTSAPVPNMPDPAPSGGGYGTRPGALWGGDNHVL